MKNEFLELNKNKTILIVDDTISNLDILIELLDQYDVIDATNAEDALNIVHNENIDLILLDIVMPEMDGYEVCELLKENKDTKDIPVIFITVQTDEDSIEKAFKVGGVDYVTKPFNEKELLSRIKTHLLLSNQTKLLHELIGQQKEILKQESKFEVMSGLLELVVNQLSKPLDMIKKVSNSDIIYQEIDNIMDILNNISYQLISPSDDLMKLDKNTTYNVSKKQLILNNNIINLSNKESILLDLFITKVNQTVSIEDICATVWADSYDKEISKESVKAQVSKLRKRLPKNCIENIYGIGYMLKYKK